MSKTNCSSCNKLLDTRSMQNCKECNAYMCQDCYDQNNGYCNNCQQSTEIFE